MGHDKQGPVATVHTRDSVALKIFPSYVDKKTVERELARLAPLRAEPSVLVADGVEVTPDGRTALRMELCAQSLTELIASSGPLSESDTIVLGRSLATALAAAHRAGLVHGRVTPGNVLFRTTGEVLLSDFGPLLRQAFPRDIAREAHHLPPETLRDGTADARADLYGLGAVLYLALSGRSPHEGPVGERPDDRVLRVLSEPVPPLTRSDLPQELVDLVSALLSKDPLTRPADAAAVAARLGGLGPQPTAVQPTPFDDFDVSGPPSAATPERRPNRTRLALGSIGAVIAITAAAVVLGTAEREPAAQPEPSAPSTPTSTPDQRAVQLELDDPVDNGKAVELTWRSSDELDFAVIVASDGQEQKPVFTQRNRTAIVPVDPLRAYCFQIQGTDSLRVWESQPKSIRGAVCKL